jgi:hypothetical protein
MRAQVTSRSAPWLRLAALLAALAPSAALAAPLDEGSSMVLLPVEGDRTIPTLSTELQAALAQLGRKVQPSTLKLDDLMFAVGCKKASVACLQQIGQTVKASALIVGQARKVGESVELSLRWFDVKTGIDQGNAVRLLPLEAGARGKILAAAVRDLLGIKTPPPSSQEATGGLSVSASIPYVEVVIDGQPRGAVPLELRGLPVGSYTIVARRDGYLSWQGKAEVKAGGLTRIEVEMVPAAGGTAAPGYFEAIRTRTWVIGAAGLLAVAIGGAFAAHLKAQQNHMDETKGVTLDEIRQMQDYKETGERDAIAANVLFGVGGAAVIAAGVLSYLDYRRARKGSPERRAEPSPRVTVGARSVGVGLSF